MKRILTLWIKDVGCSYLFHPSHKPPPQNTNGGGMCVYIRMSYSMQQHSAFHPQFHFLCCGPCPNLGQDQLILLSLTFLYFVNLVHLVCLLSHQLAVTALCGGFT